MRRRSLLRNGAMLAGATALGMVAARSVAASRPVRAQRVAPDVWFVEGEAALGSAANRNFISNAGFVVTGRGVVVVDALGSPPLAQELLREIARVTRQRVTHVIVTHYHADHIYGLQVFRDLGAQIIAHPSAREYLHSETAQLRLQQSRVDFFPWVDERTQLTPADRWLEDRETLLQVGSHRFRIRHVGPAHTPEDLAVYVQRPRVLFAGDLVFRGRLPFVGQADSEQWIASLSALLDQQPRLLVPGHGPVSSTPREDLILTRDYLVHLRAVMGAAARDLEPFEEAYARADWSRYEKLPLFRAANRINAYNTYLLMEQRQAPGSK